MASPTPPEPRSTPSAGPPELAAPGDQEDEAGSVPEGSPPFPPRAPSPGGTEGSPPVPQPAADQDAGEGSPPPDRFHPVAVLRMAQSGKNCAQTHASTNAHTRKRARAQGAAKCRAYLTIAAAVGRDENRMS